MLIKCNEFTDNELVMLTRDILNKTLGDQISHNERAKLN